MIAARSVPIRIGRILREAPAVHVVYEAVAVVVQPVARRLVRVRPQIVPKVRVRDVHARIHDGDQNLALLALDLVPRLGQLQARQVRLLAVERVVRRGERTARYPGLRRCGQAHAADTVDRLRLGIDDARVAGEGLRRIGGLRAARIGQRVDMAQRLGARRESAAPRQSVQEREGLLKARHAMRRRGGAEGGACRLARRGRLRPGGEPHIEPAGKRLRLLCRLRQGRVCPKGRKRGQKRPRKAPKRPAQEPPGAAQGPARMRTKHRRISHTRMR